MIVKIGQVKMIPKPRTQAQSAAVAQPRIQPGGMVGIMASLPHLDLAIAVVLTVMLSFG